MTGFGDLNPKFPLILAISVFMSSLQFILSRVEHEKGSITLGPGIKPASPDSQSLVCIDWGGQDGTYSKCPYNSNSKPEKDQWSYKRSPDYCPGITTTTKNKKHCCKSFFKISAVA